MVSGHNAAILARLLPPFYETLKVPDGRKRIDAIRQKAIAILIKDKQYQQALETLAALDERQPKLEAACREGMGDFAGAARAYRDAGDFKNALNCYRSIPDVAASVALMREMGGHPALESLEWVERLNALIAQRPEKFTRTVTPHEKQVLEGALERALGVQRRKPTRKSAGTPRTAVKRAAPRKRVASRVDDPF
jgi:hypothetical protein